jgi:hypothetical protein
MTYIALPSVHCRPASLNRLMKSLQFYIILIDIQWRFHACRMRCLLKRFRMLCELKRQETAAAMELSVPLGWVAACVVLGHGVGDDRRSRGWSTSASPFHLKKDWDCSFLARDALTYSAPPSAHRRWLTRGRITGAEIRCRIDVLSIFTAAAQNRHIFTAVGAGRSSDGEPRGALNIIRLAAS